MGAWSNPGALFCAMRPLPHAGKILFAKYSPIRHNFSIALQIFLRGIIGAEQRTIAQQGFFMMRVKRGNSDA